MKVDIKQSWVEHDGFVQIEKARLQYEKFNGQMSSEITRFHYHRGDAVAVLIYDEITQRVLLIKQFRYAVYAKTGDGWLTECIAGIMEENEGPLELARREVFEETGLHLKSAELLAHYFFSPGGCSDRVHLYLGKVEDPHQSVGVGGLQQEGEEIQSQWVPLEEALQRVDEGKIADAKTIIALTLLERRLRKQ
ncbi:MAG: NUDIX hydrolase [Acidobacteria bacterium]|nr:MAG: NUDIX hydrolase [Acidobacteriota bacterium]